MTTDDQLNLLTRIMKEQLKWTRLAGMAQVQAIFESSLKTKDEKMVYELSDGKRSTRDIEKMSNVGRNKISSLWKKWYQMGIMERSDKYERPRMKRSFSLSDVGIDTTLHDNDSTEEFE